MTLEKIGECLWSVRIEDFLSFEYKILIGRVKSIKRWLNLSYRQINTLELNE